MHEDHQTSLVRAERRRLVSLSVWEHKRVTQDRSPWRWFWAEHAESLSSQGLTQHALTTLLHIEPLIFEATALLNAASIVNRGHSEEHQMG
jgi:hypothetical protein